MSINAMPREPIYNNAYSAGALSAYQIVQGGVSAILVAAGVTAVPYGVLARDVAAGAQADVQTGGWAVVLAGTAGMTEGSLVMPEAGGTGFGVDATASAGVGVAVLGRCEKAATSGKLGLVRIGIAWKQIDD